MRPIHLLSCLAPCLVAITGCAGTTSFVHADATLGRVVVYRNGVAYFERTAHLDGDQLRLAVPADKVDDFLKSLTVVDARTGEPAPIAYPTRAPRSESGLIDMKISLTGPSSHDLRLSYVTEAPSWKPSYRLVLDKGGKVKMQAWAIVDNTSGEDWQNVQLGVGSSSALSFRFDLRSVRLVQRETLHQDDLFAQAPPTGGGGIYDQTRGMGVSPTSPQGPRVAAQKVMAELSDETLMAAGNKDLAPEAQAQVVVTGVGRGYKAPAPSKPMEARAYRGAEQAGRGWGGRARGKSYDLPPAQAAAPPPPQSPIELAARRLQASHQSVVVEGYADDNDRDKYTASLERANRAREQLIRAGVDPSQVVAVGSGEKAGKKGGVSIVEAVAQAREDARPEVLLQRQAQALGTDPIGTSHFESKARMTVPRGTSAMVSILSTETSGEVVYFYDAESPRGNATYPFRAVRVQNPTDSVLEQGPVTVFGEGKFIGEGMVEPIPARSVTFIPFALDRQLVVERKESAVDRIARIITVQRGVFSTEVQHTRRTVFALHNRSGDKATVYVRHAVAAGYRLTKAPDQRGKLGSAEVFRVDVPAGAKTEVTIEESTPIFRSTDIRSPAGMEMVTAYLTSDAAVGPLRSAVGDLLRLHREMADVEQRIETTREQMDEYRARMNELHAQVVTLKVVKTAGPLMQSLEKKLQEVSDKLSKATIDLVSLQEKLMVTRIKFQDGVADLSLEKKALAPARDKT